MVIEFNFVFFLNIVEFDIKFRIFEIRDDCYYMLVCLMFFVFKYKLFLELLSI